jgi:hypothetical protein
MITPRLTALSNDTDENAELDEHDGAIDPPAARRRPR